MSEARYTAEQCARARSQLELGLAPLPRHMHAGVRGFVIQGRPTGGFLQSIFDGDFEAAAARADMSNLAAMDSWATLVRAHIPRGCWGSREKREAWIKGGGIEGRQVSEKGDT